MELAILGWGTALPGHAITLEETIEFARGMNGLTVDQSRALPILYRRTGIKTKHSVLAQKGPGGLSDQDFFAPAVTPEGRGPTTAERMRFYAERAPVLACAAAAQALERAATSPEVITHLVTVTCTGFYAPGFDIELMRNLGLRPTTERVQVGFMGCHGALNGLKAARGLAAAAGPEARVLVCATELCTIHYQYGWDPDQVVANALFADGAAAVVAGEVEVGGDLKAGDRRLEAGGTTIGSTSALQPPASSTSGLQPPASSLSAAWRLVATGSCLFADSTDVMTWLVGDHGFEMKLSARVPGLIERGLMAWIEPWLAGQGIGLKEVGSWAIHPGGPRILTSTERALGLEPEATAVSREVLRQCGNMSSPTILFILERLAESGAARPCVALAFGPGLVAEAGLFR